MGKGGRGSNGKEFADWRSKWWSHFLSPAGSASLSARVVLALREFQREWWMAEKMSGHSPDSFGYSHMTGGYAGGQAEYARVLLLMSVPFKIRDEKVLFLRHPPTRYNGCRELQSPSRPYYGGRLSL
jgi:hypothetical protein